MRTVMLAVALPLLLPLALGAQERDTTARADSVTDESELPREVAREAVDLFNAPGTLRVNGSLDIVAAQEVTGDVAVLNGPVTIAGRVLGRVVAINADVTLRPTARIEGDLLVVGGVLEGSDAAIVGGQIRSYRQVLQYREEGDRIAAERGVRDEERWWSRWRHQQRGRTWSDLRLASARTYNRVEGLPIYLGPSLRQNVGPARLTVDAFGVVRTADNFRWDSENLGHTLRTELRYGDRPGVAIGGRLFDIVDAVETWQLTEGEVGLASFFLHRDFRDYFNRHGGGGYVSFLAGDAVDLTVGLTHERWASRELRDPFTLFRNQQGWRPNPRMDDGRFHVATATLRLDTRNDVDDPWSGWYVVADYERGTGEVTSAGPRAEPALYVDPPPPEPPTPLGLGHVAYGRALVDVRRYNRISPDAQVNLRLVLGGWLHGDPLPLQRRLSVGGPGTIPGYDFRSFPDDEDVLQCNPTYSPRGRPALCDRIALLQAEYRGDLRLAWNPFSDAGRGFGFGSNTDAVWLLFADAGRGWLVGPREGEVQYRRGQLPSFGTFRTDVGLGIEIYPIGLYVAKSVADAKEPANFVVRVKRRF
jgi:hypothetical protein